LEEFKVSWVKDRNVGGERAMVEARAALGDVAKQTGGKRKRKGFLSTMLRPIRRRLGTADVEAITSPIGGTATPIRASKVPVESQVDPVVCSALVDLSAQEAGSGDECIDEEGDNDMEYYKKLMGADVVWVEGVDGRTRQGAVRHTKNKDPELAREYRNLVAEADRAMDILPSVVPDVQRSTLDSTVLYFHNKDVKFPLVMQKALLSRDCQDVISSADWTPLLGRLRLPAIGKFNPVRPILGQMDCSVGQQVRIFAQIAFKSFIFPSIDHGMGLALRLSQTVASFVLEYEKIDIVEAPEELSADIGTWITCWVGIATLGNVDFDHESSEEPATFCANSATRL
jgi:hypothetical protein